MSESTLLLIGDEPGLAEQVREICQSITQLRLVRLNGVDAAYQYEAWETVSLVLIHQTGGGSAMQVVRLLRMIAAARRPVATIVLADRCDADQASALIRVGVASYLGGPLNITRLTYLIDVLTIRHRAVTRAPAVVFQDQIRNPAGPTLVMRAEITPNGTDDRTSQPFPAGDTPQVAALFDQIRRVAPQNRTILLGGETGTGKTWLARQIHELFSRHTEPFLTVDCGRLSSSSSEGNLFGHVRGAFRGADADRPEKFASVGGGTLFFDGVDALPAAVQTKLLRVVEERAFEPIGATAALPLLARLIAASNRPLEAEVAESRSDLCYRLNVVSFQLPPLRDRGDDIATLAAQLLPNSLAMSG